MSLAGLGRSGEKPWNPHIWLISAPYGHSIFGWWLPVVSQRLDCLEVVGLFVSGPHWRQWPQLALLFTASAAGDRRSTLQSFHTELIMWYYLVFGTNLFIYFFFIHLHLIPNCNKSSSITVNDLDQISSGPLSLSSSLNFPDFLCEMRNSIPHEKYQQRKACFSFFFLRKKERKIWNICSCDV